MATLSEMRASMARLRALLGRKNWDFDIKTTGTVKQLQPSNPMYCRLFSYRDNRLIFPPRMLATCKSNGVRLKISCCTAFGAITVEAPNVERFEALEPSKIVSMIENYMGSGDPHND